MTTIKILFLLSVFSSMCKFDINFKCARFTKYLSGLLTILYCSCKQKNRVLVVVMFIDETFYDDTLKKIFTGATPHHNKYNSFPELFFNITSCSF